jgi:transposase
LTGLSENEIIKFGVDARIKIKKYLDMIDKIEFKYSNKIVKNKIRMKIVNRCNRKIICYVDELHWKIINYLIKSYATIIIGDMCSNHISYDYPTQRTRNNTCLHNSNTIVQSCNTPRFTRDITQSERPRNTHNQSPNLNQPSLSENNQTLNINERIMLAFNFTLFYKRLEYKCMMNKINFRIVNENYTTKICTSCGHYNETDGRKYVCNNCNFSTDRDINACKGILIKACY